ncbi:MAG: hypothetical protein ABII20_03030 [Candidatus Omnitrophota bacterium]|nr:hypothetical protein [Candidatus Omnitrophota bacterium]MBU3929196.1 hypothetical protein [bacterium]MBU4123740.1 hypothetical protein [bacterium]
MNVARLVVTIPKDEFKRVEQEKKERGITRSAFVHQIIDFFFRKEDEFKKETRYIAGYKKYPENIKEAAAVEKAAFETMGEF